MSYLFKVKVQGACQRIKFSERELAKNCDDVYADFNSKGM